MFDLPIFPLNTVLFPGMPLQLHIFEDRYKEMMNHCISEGAPFGVVLIQRGQAQHAPLAKPFEVGCLAQIAQVQPLGDGRLNMVAVGQHRFRIHNLLRDKAYLVGRVETLQLEKTSHHTFLRRKAKLELMFRKFIDVLTDMGQVDFDLEKLPEDGIELAYMAATLMNTSNEHKQALLAINHAEALVEEVYQTCRQEISITRMMAESPLKDNDNPFSLN